MSGGTERQTKTELARRLGVSRGSFYYRRRLPARDEALRAEIEEVMRRCPDYGYRPIADALGVNRKRARRVMRKFNLKPARRAKTPRKPLDVGQEPKKYPCITKLWCPIIPDLVWVSDCNRSFCRVVLCKSGPC